MSIGHVEKLEDVCAVRTPVEILVPRRPKPWQRAISDALAAAPDIHVRVGVSPGRTAAACVVDLRRPFGASAAPAPTVYAVAFGRPRHRLAPPFFEDVLAGDHAVEATLTVRRLGTTTTLRRGYFSARITRSRTMLDAAPEIAAWLVAALRATAPRPQLAPRSAAAAPPALRAPTPLALARALWLEGRFRLARIARRFVARRSRWAVGTIDAPIEALLARDPPIRWHRDLGHPFLADPFGLPERDDIVLCENMNVARGKGEIVAITLDGSRAPLDVLTHEAHLSYPFVFVADGVTYMLPEMHEANKLELYRVDTAPLGVRHVRTLLDIDACDATIVRVRDRWWLFCSRASALPDINLFIYYADALDGPWHAHALNPVKTDVRGARPGGTPFFVGEQLYRPAQDCSLSYGGALALNRVDVLTPVAFEETTVRRIAPDPAGPYPHGLHTLSAGGTRCYVDGRRDAFN
ncbi:MAG: hypothetical protein NVSMB19_14900 [Vulcanimicrobiaceae bacterium]